MSVLSIAAFRFRVAQLNPHRPIPVDIRPDDGLLRQLAQELDVTRIESLRLDGRLSAQGDQDWMFTGHVSGVVIQPCVVTLEDVVTSIEEDIRRIWVHDYQHPQDDEMEMGDEEVDPLGAVIDMGDVLSEALSLALPQYPRLEAVPEPDAAPQEASGDEGKRKPFADLATLLQKRDK